jgi:hypothetical protein
MGTHGYGVSAPSPDRARVRAMRRFTSYGPVESEANFAVERRDLVNQCVEQLVGTTPEERGGHYFTIWGPRQTGKTWIMRQAIKAIRERYGDRFVVGKMSMQGAIMTTTRGRMLCSSPSAPDDASGFDIDIPAPTKAHEWAEFTLPKRGGREF